MDNIKSLQKRVKKLFIDTELQQKDVADKLGIHKSTLANAVSGYRTGKSSEELLIKAEEYLLTQLVS